MSTPATKSFRMTSSEELAGPSVATILAFRFLRIIFRFGFGRARSGAGNASQQMRESREPRAAACLPGGRQEHAIVGPLGAKPQLQAIWRAAGSWGCAMHQRRLI